MSICDNRIGHPCANSIRRCIISKVFKQGCPIYTIIYAGTQILAQIGPPILWRWNRLRPYRCITFNPPNHRTLITNRLSASRCAERKLLGGSLNRACQVLGQCYGIGLLEVVGEHNERMVVAILPKLATLGNDAYLRIIYLARSNQRLE